MFKKLVVGALATGIALTGGIGAASASTENVSNTPSSIKQLGVCYPKENGKYVREVKNSNEIFANYFTEQACGGTVHWYLKGIKYTNENGGTYIGKYEGWIQ
ncbi:LCI fold-containing protein [Bacillus sp. NPDC094077]|uniref:LCI fold-containing protein n=1 Tax=Bacillus sp. NPDC094077 TaxID=3390932 RepID=UPI003D027ED4